MMQAGRAAITDFEGRSVVRSGKSLKITGDSAAHMIVRWRFAKPKSVTVDGKRGEDDGRICGSGWGGVRPLEGECGGVAVAASYVATCLDCQAPQCGQNDAVGLMGCPQAVQGCSVGMARTGCRWTALEVWAGGSAGGGGEARIWLAM